MLNAEMDQHLRSDASDGRANTRNGYGQKTVLTDTGRLALDIPRDRQGTSIRSLSPNISRRFPGFDDKIVSLYARGMSVRETQGHLRELYGIDVSPDLVSTVTDAVLDEVADLAEPSARAGLPLGVLRRFADQGPDLHRAPPAALAGFRVLTRTVKPSQPR